MAKQILTDLDFNNVSKIINLPDPVNATEASNKAYVDSVIEGLAWKDDARVGSIVDITLTAPGATIDGITMVTSDRVLLKNQTLPAENGIYIFNGAASPMTRSPDANTYNELEQAVVSVSEGTNAGTSFRQSGINGTIDTTAVTWGAFGTTTPSATETTQGIAEIATQAEVDAGTDDVRFVTALKLTNFPGLAARFSADIGDAAATQFVVTHNLNSRDVSVQVFRTVGPFDEVLVDIEATSVNTVTIRFAVAPALNAFRAVIKQ